MVYLLQKGDVLRREKVAIFMADLPRFHCTLEDIQTLASDPRDLVPVGSVEFVTEFCNMKGIAVPGNISYPEELRRFLGREIWSDTYGNVDSNLFVKPQQTKVFTGAIKESIDETVNDAEPVWVSTPVQFTSEYRFYIIDKEIAGYSRYDPGDNDDIEPDVTVVEQMVAAYATQPIAYSIDVGIHNGDTILIEVNDGWSLGYYPWGSMTEQRYIELIRKRWQEIAAK
jgi:hypothetical protein